MGLTQKELGEKSGVSQRSISRLEQGESLQLDNFIKIMIALNLGENIDILIPDQAKRPSYYLENKMKTKQRVRKTGAAKADLSGAMNNDLNGRSISLGNKNRNYP